MTPSALTVHFTVNKPLTPKQRSRVIENDEYAAFLRRDTPRAKTTAQAAGLDR